MKVLNLSIKRNDDGSKHLDMQLHGVIDGGWGDTDETSSADFVAALKEHANAKTVDVRVNSVGGSAFGGVAMYNALQAHPGATCGIVEGLAASAASLAVLGCKTVVMGRGSMMMIHPPSTVAMGNAGELRKTADVLDKIQGATAGIYTSKTGKSLDQINALINAETWMDADEAVASGFADKVGVGKETDSEPPPAPAATADGVVWNGVNFPRSALPEKILALAKAPAPPVVAQVAAAAAPAPSPAPVLAIVPAAAAPAPLTRAELATRAPEVLAALLEEGRVAGVTAERARFQSIDDLGLSGPLVAAAKYGPAPSDAPTLAMAAVKAGQHAGAEMLALHRAESAPIVAVVPGAPEQSTDSAIKAAKQIAAFANAGRGGVK